MNITRICRHFWMAQWQIRCNFPVHTLAAIKSAIRDAEASHVGEIRFALEAALRPGQLMQGMTARERALEVFSQLKIWDTQHNNGVLIYVLLGDRAVEIVADRGIHLKAGGDVAWRRIIQTMQHAFKEGRFEAGAVSGIAAVADHLAQHFPVADSDTGELPDDVALL